MGFGDLIYPIPILEVEGDSKAIDDTERMSVVKQKKLKYNGLFQAWEIVDLKLDAKLAVLSACQAALGEDRGGDGLISLSRAFQITSARSMLASAWAVNDESTAKFMIHVGGQVSFRSRCLGTE